MNASAVDYARLGVTPQVELPIQQAILKTARGHDASRTPQTRRLRNLPFECNRRIRHTLFDWHSAIVTVFAPNQHLHSQHQNMSANSHHFKTMLFMTHSFEQEAE
jgi:hypothetical protein